MAHGDLKKLVLAWSNENAEARRFVDQLLKNNGLSSDAIMAQTTLDNIDVIGELDRLISSYDYRRDAALRELERRRDSMAKRVRAVTNSLAQDADVEILDAPKGGDS